MSLSRISQSYDLIEKNNLELKFVVSMTFIYINIHRYQCFKVLKHSVSTYLKIDKKN